MLSVCIAGATGWTGEALVRGVHEAADLELRSAVSRSAAGGEIDGAPVYASAAEALQGVDVLIDYTSVAAVKDNTLAAIEAGVSVVIGTSGLTASDFDDIEAAARERSVGSWHRGTSRWRPRCVRPRRFWPHAICRIGRSSTTQAPPSPTSPAGPLVSWRSGWAMSAGRSLATR
jgi:hypothetical protein